ncbi:6-phosphofructokinase [Candidatus Woesearchaeota archaeon]|nr:6-phosphofructokinase [Candidatus Woesearchaeota archaeon]
MKIAILTSGGDAPGLNAVIRAVVFKAMSYGHNVIGFRYGWDGLINQNYIEMNRDDVDEIHLLGGTILGTSRINPLSSEEIKNKCIDNFRQTGADVLVVIGGDDTLGVANELNKIGIPVIGIPKTIDNDLNCTDYTFGFDTAINIATECLDRLRTTAKSHNRVMVVEMMGREAGWITLKAGLAGGANFILIPEVPFDIDEICDMLKKRKENGKPFSIIAVAEGAKPHDYDLIVENHDRDGFGHVRMGGIGKFLSHEIEKRTGFETRVTVLGHLQRGGSPSAFDRVLATTFGVRAIDLVESKDFGKMVALHGTKVVSVPLQEVVAQQKTVSFDEYNIAKSFFG